MKPIARLSLSERRQQTAAHEAGHALGFLTAGVRVEELRAGNGAGHCRAERVPRAEPTIVAIWCGPSAVELLHGDRAGSSAELSDADHSLIRAAEEEFCELNGLGSAAPFRERWRHQAWMLLHDRRAALLSLSAKLDRSGEMSRLAITAFVHRDDSGLAEFRHLYPRPSPVKAPTVGNAPPPAKVLRRPGGIGLAVCRPGLL